MMTETVETVAAAAAEAAGSGIIGSDESNSYDEEKRYCTMCTCDHHDTSTFVQETDMWKFELRHMKGYKHACFKCVGCSNPLTDGTGQVWMCKHAWDHNHSCDIAYCVGCFFKSDWNKGWPSRAGRLLIFSSSDYLNGMNLAESRVFGLFNNFPPSNCFHSVA
jgi:hypothetical protein